MNLDLFYITNRADAVQAAQNAGVTHIFIDLEKRGKEARQKHVNSVKSNHEVKDIIKLRPLINASKLLVRTDPVFEGTKQQIDEVVAAGADVVMLPMFKTRQEVEFFLRCLNGRAEAMLLLETREAFENAASILRLPGIDSLHIGLNDLHLSFGMDFMFEPLANGMVDQLANLAARFRIPFGFGGIARLGQGALPAEYILAEHKRLGSKQVILSRSFLNLETEQFPEGLDAAFGSRLAELRNFEATLEEKDGDYFRENREIAVRKIAEIAARIREQKKNRSDGPSPG